MSFPLGVITCVTGVSGSGKSTLVLDTLYRALAQRLNRSHERSGAYKTIDGIAHLDRVIHVDQSPIGRTPRSNPATYTGLFTHIRDLFAQLPEARMRGYGPGRFSFNVKGGRCEACQGDGIITIEMHFLPDVFVTCEVCGGKRYNRDTLEIQYKGKNIAEVLDMTVLDAMGFLSSVPPIRQKLETLRDVGLDYIHLGQSATTLVGRRGAAHQAHQGVGAPRHRPHAVHPGRAHHRPAFRGHPAAARSAGPVGRQRQHGDHHRAQSGSD